MVVEEVGNRVVEDLHKQKLVMEDYYHANHELSPIWADNANHVVQSCLMFCETAPVHQIEDKMSVATAGHIEA